MGKEIDITISNLDDAINLLNEELVTADELAARASQLSFSNCHCHAAQSTGTCARTMVDFTSIQLCKIITEYKTLLTKTTELLTDAKTKYSNMDNSLAKEISK